MSFAIILPSDTNRVTTSSGMKGSHDGLIYGSCDRCVGDERAGKAQEKGVLVSAAGRRAVRRDSSLREHVKGWRPLRPAADVLAPLRL